MPKHWKIAAPVFAIIVVITAVAYYKSPSLFGRRTSLTKMPDTSGGSLQSYLDLAQSLNPRGTNATTSVTFLAVGDIMLSRNVAMTSFKALDVDLPFRQMADALQSTNFNFANLESPFYPAEHPCIASGTEGIVGGHSMIFGAPCNMVHGLVDFNFKILNLANNHAFDQGLAGVDITRSTLDDLGLTHEGTGDNLDEAWTPAIATANGIKICFVGASYASVNDGGKTTNNYVARIEDTARLQAAITTAKSECDFTVATMHAGTEYTRTPNQAQITFAHAAIDDGADLVIGSHPHWVQPVEKYNNKYIFYSLGNFIFDQAWSQETQEGLTLKMTISKADCHPELVSGSRTIDSGSEAGMTCGDSLQGTRTPAKLESIELIPIIIANSQPRPATAEESANILKKINLLNPILKP